MASGAAASAADCGRRVAVSSAPLRRGARYRSARCSRGEAVAVERLLQSDDCDTLATPHQWSVKSEFWHNLGHLSFRKSFTAIVLQNPSLGKKCEVCKKKCSGDVLKANDKYFHIQCFQCKQCSRPLGESGFYTAADGSYLCPEDYRALGRGTTRQPAVSKTPDVDSRPAAVNGEQTINNVKESEQLSPLGSPSGTSNSPSI
ncbi:LIM domain protein [Teladorsagia circumcincta]|uniref:LIM domain protein n=1 Tax=Teladorsagia circumcincta TaxID=45464 RepID=A0A2G9UTA4_TELCI|nr:LIM domain protein [Teladorsagia circumcincta]